MKELEALKETIESFLRQPRPDTGLEVSEDGELLFRLPAHPAEYLAGVSAGEANYELRLEAGKLLLHLWSEERNWVRRVLSVEEAVGGARLVLSVYRFGQRRPGRLVIAVPRVRRASDATRRKYRALLRRLLEREFPHAQIEGLTAAPDLKNSFSGLYTRARVGAGKSWWAVLGVNAAEDAAVVDGILTYGLIWLDWNRNHHPDRVFAGLRLFLPRGRAQLTANRLAALDPTLLACELYEVDEAEFSCQRMDVRDIGNLDTRLLPAAWAAEVLRSEQSSVERIRLLAPEIIKLTVPAERHELSLCVRGLEFARAVGGKVFFGVGGAEELLTKQNWPKLETLVRELVRRRVPDGKPNDSFYRLQAERWLESVALERIHSLDPRLERGQLYRQVPAFAAAERGVVDLLGATRDGQLVVIELKASAEIHLPLQALDYWQRVRACAQHAELVSFGYFSEQLLRPGPPELLLVAPAFQFHPTTETILRYFAPEVRITCVGINEDWRRGLRVVFRKTR